MEDFWNFSKCIHSDVCPQTPELRHYKHMNRFCDVNYMIFLWFVLSIINKINLLDKYLIGSNQKQ